MTPTVPVVEDYVAADYLIPEDEVADVLSGEDSDHGDKELHAKSLEEVNDLLGVILPPDTIKTLNAAIDKVTNSSEANDGYCTYYAILNGIFAKKFNTTSGVTEERFATALPSIYAAVKPFKEELGYATVLNVVDTVNNINDVLVRAHGYALNVYERKCNSFLVDLITTQKKVNRYVVKALYWYADGTGEQIPIDYIQLMFCEVEGAQIMDMGVCVDMSVILKEVEQNQDGTFRRWRRLDICERCRVCFVRRSSYNAHVKWCKGVNSQQFLFSQEDLQTFEDYVRCTRHP